MPNPLFLQNLQDTINITLGIALVLCYAFQFLYLFLPFFKKLPPQKKSTVIHRLAVVVCARNEEKVIPCLIESLREQDYPKESYDIFVLADNCTDRTAEVSRTAGAIVYERQNAEKTGKGYALDELLSHLKEDYGDDAYDAFVIFDADNLAEKNFLTEINKVFSDGYPVVVSYRNTKNFGKSWLSSGCGIWFIRDSHFMNGSRMRIGVSCNVSGTGYLYSNELKKEYGGFPFHLLTEDYELMVVSAAKGKCFGYAENAMFYDEQAETFAQSWRQRVRWSKGGYQVARRHGRELLRGIFSKNFPICYDVAMSIFPALIIGLAGILGNLVLTVMRILASGSAKGPLLSILQIFVFLYLLVMANAAIPVFSEWKKIRATPWEKIRSIFTFPFFLFTFLPIAICAFFSKGEWKPIEHGDAVELSDIDPEAEKAPNERTEA